MADKLSSPSSSSNGGSNHTPPKKGTDIQEDDDNFLVVRKQPPDFVFVDECFEILVGLEVTRLTGDSPTGTEVELTAVLQEQPKSSTDFGKLIILGKDRNTVSTTKPCSLKCKIQLKGQLRRDKRVSCLISISARDDTHNIASTTTSTIQVVNYKLRIATDSSWSNIWYKDEGGRDKSMEVVAELYNKDNVQHRERVPLRLTLYHAPSTDDCDLVKVTNQEILRSLGSAAKLYTEKSTGKTTVRFRIEDVSKNHQGQDFVLQIAPDYRKGFLDIGPGLTPAVSVRSKRNKRQRNASIGGRPDRRVSSPGEHSSVSSRPFGEQPGRSVWGQEGIATTDPARLREAMQSIVHWTEEVVNGLYPLQWQILGYAQHPDGSPDYSRPHYSMTNPNPCISRVLAIYTESTRENLWLLSQAVEQAANSQSQSGGRESSYGRRSPDISYTILTGQRGPPPQPTPTHASAHTPPGMVPPPQAAIMGGMNVGSGMHPAIASEAFRPKMMAGEPHLQHPTQQQYPHSDNSMPYPSPQGHGRPQGFPPQQYPMQHLYYRGRPVPTQVRRGVMEETESNLLSEPFPPPSLRAVGDSSSPPSHHGQSDNAGNELHSRESEVEYVLAKEYKALRTGERLGFPAYSASRELLGFYRESRSKAGGVSEFSPVMNHAQDFGPMEIIQASEILGDAIAKKSTAVHSLKDWGSIANLIDHALVYDWTKDMNPSGGTENSQSGSDGE